MRHDTTTERPRPSTGMIYVAKRRIVKQKGAGWMGFAATMLLAAALVDATWGILAIADNAYFSGDQLLYGSVSLWGWLFLVVVPVQLLAATLIYADHPFGSALGLMVAGFSALGHLTLVSEHPVAASVTLALDGLVVYALAAYGFARR